MHLGTAVNIRLVLIGAAVSIISIIISVIMIGSAGDSLSSPTSFEVSPGYATTYYDSFEVSLTDNTKLEVTAPNLDLYIIIYNQTFDPSDPTKNIIYQFNCDPIFDNENNPCDLPKTSSLSGNFTIVITSFDELEKGDWQVHDGAIELATGTLSAYDETFTRPEFFPLFSEGEGGSAGIGLAGFALCCFGPLIGMILLIIGIASKDPATVAAMTVVGSAPVAAAHISGAGASAGAFVASQSPLSQPVVHGAVPDVMRQATTTQPVITPTTPTSPTTSGASTTTTPTTPTTTTTATTTPPTLSPDKTAPPDVLNVPTPEQLGISSQSTSSQSEEVSGEGEIVAEQTLTVEQLYTALGKTFTTADRKEILNRASVISVNMTIKDVERTMGMGISSTHKGGQTITGKMNNGDEIKVRLLKSAESVDEGDGWTGTGRAVDWNGIRRILIIESN